MKQGLTYFQIHFFRGKIPLPFTFNHVINAAIKVGLEEYNFLPLHNPSPQGGLNVLNNTAFTLEQGDTLGKVSHLFLQLLRDLCQGKSQFRLLQCNFCKVGLKEGRWMRSNEHPHHTSRNHFHLQCAKPLTYIIKRLHGGGGGGEGIYRGEKAIEWTKLKLANCCRGSFFIIILLPLWPYTSFRPSLHFLSSGILACICSPLTLLSAQSWQCCQRWPLLPRKAACKDKALQPRQVSTQLAAPVTIYIYFDTSFFF